MTDFSSSSGSTSYKISDQTNLMKLDLEGDFIKRLMRDLSAHNQDFLDESVFEIENYF